MKPYCGMSVVYIANVSQGGYGSSEFNGHNAQPGVITKDWGGCVNVKVLPDCGTPFDSTSCSFYPSEGAAMEALPSAGRVCYPANPAEQSSYNTLG